MFRSLKLKLLLRNLKQLKYSNNTFNSKIHEESVEKIIIESGFKHKNTISTNETNACYYINQPNGSQRPPDFIVVDNNESVELECKSKKTGYKPMWNSSYPNRTNLYIFTTQKDNRTLIIRGNKITTPKLETLLEKYKKDHKIFHDKFNKELKKLTKEDNPYDISVYPRHMFVQNKHFDEKDNMDTDTF